MICTIFPSLIMIVVLIMSNSASAQLSENFYSVSCPNVLSTIQTAVDSAVAAEARMGASLLRLHFHDCFVNGCDASVLLDDTANFTGEKNAGPNANSLLGFEVIDNIKSELESTCAGVVSCADILTVAARDSVVALGGPSWTVLLGRRDSLTASQREADNNLPPPTANLTTLIQLFRNQGLTEQEMIALSGAHTIGQSQCSNFRTRIYNSTNIDSNYAASLQTNCPSTGGDTNLSPLDVATPDTFDNDYYTNLLNNRGLLHSDQELFNGGSADSLVQSYSSNSDTFFRDFGNAMIGMANIKPLTGTRGQIRTNCRRVN